MKKVTLNIYQKNDIVNIIRSDISSSEQKLVNLKNLLESKYSFTVSSGDESKCFVKEVAISKQSYMDSVYDFVSGGVMVGIAGSMLTVAPLLSNLKGVSISDKCTGVGFVAVPLALFYGAFSMYDGAIHRTSDEFDAAISKCFLQQSCDSSVSVTGDDSALELPI